MEHCPPSAKASRRRPTGKHLRARTTGLRIVNRTAFTILLVTGCVAMAVLSVPQARKLRSLSEELARVNARETHVRAQKERRGRELAALRNDPAYLELVARDRLDLYRSGERIYRIEKD